MKLAFRNWTFAIAIFTFFSINSCKEKIDTIEPYRDVAYIWSFLDKSDTAHYVIIQKGYINPTGNANILAQYPDSIYFSNLDVKVEEYNNSTLLNTYPLTRVNLVQEGYKKDSGLFQNQINYAYKFKANLSSNYTYKVVATKDNKKFVASTPVLPANASTLNIYYYYWRGGTDSLSLIPDRGQILVWNKGSGAEIFSGYMDMDYYDVKTTNPLDSTKHTVRWALIENLIDKVAGQKSITAFSNNFYNQIANDVPNAPSGVNRYIGECRFSFFAGSSRLVRFIEMKKAQTGLSSSQVNPEFKEGFETADTYGLIDTRGTAKYVLTLADTTYYYLKNLPSLTAKNIKGKR